MFTDPSPITASKFLRKPPLLQQAMHGIFSHVFSGRADAHVMRINDGEGTEQSVGGRLLKVAAAAGSVPS